MIMKDIFPWRIVAVTVAMFLLLAHRSWGVPPTAPTANQMFVYIGTYAAENEDGIHICRLDLATGQLARIGAVAGIKNPSFQALHPNGRFLYSVSESSDYEGQPAGSIHAFAVDPATGQLTFLNSQSSLGAGPVPRVGGPCRRPCPGSQLHRRQRSCSADPEGWRSRDGECVRSTQGLERASAPARPACALRQCRSG